MSLAFSYWWHFEQRRKTQDRNFKDFKKLRIKLQDKISYISIVAFFSVFMPGLRAFFVFVFGLYGLIETLFIIDALVYQNWKFIERKIRRWRF